MRAKSFLTGVLFTGLALGVGASLVLAQPPGPDDGPPAPSARPGTAFPPGPAQPYPADGLEPAETETVPYLRWQWFYQQRAYPYDEIPPGAMQRARGYLRRAISAGQLTGAPSVGGKVWEQIGPAPVAWDAYHFSGRVRSIAVQNPAIIYIGSASGGVWKTTNGGTSWTPLTDDQPSLTMGSVAIDPSNTAVIYAGTGEYSGRGPGLYGAGLLKSTNSGNDWSHIPGPWDTLQGGAEIQKIILIPGPSASNPTDDTILIAGNTGLFRSTQGGVDFSVGSIPVLGGNISDVVIDPTNSDILYAAWHGVGIYRSTDGGQTWDADLGDPDLDPIWTPPGGCVIQRGALALALTNTNVLYAAFQTPPNGCGIGTGAVFRTTNAQAAVPAFTQLTTPVYPPGHVWAGGSWCGGQCGYDLALIVQPIDPDGGGPLNPEDIVYAGGVGLFRSTDGGSTWTNLGEPPTGIHVDQHTFAFGSTGALYVGNDGGVCVHPSPATALSIDPGWVHLNTNLATIQFYPGASVHPDYAQVGARLALGGTQDNGTVKYGGSPQWDTIFGGDGAFSAIDFTVPDDVWYISAQNLYVLKTTNGGANFAPAITGLPRSGTLFIAPLVMCPDNAQVLIATDDIGVYRTNNGAGNWSDNSPDLGTVWHEAPRALAFAAGSSCNTYFAGGSNPTARLFRTTTGGGTSWTDWTDITGNLPNRAVSDIAVHETDANIVYVSFSGFCGDYASCPGNQGHVWKTITALAEPPFTPGWTDLTGGKGLPNVPVNAIALDPADPQHLYMGTDLGVYRSVDGGTTWELFGNGLPNVAVTDLLLNSKSRVLVAATCGRSMYQLRLAALYYLPLVLRDA